jgi:hypothetical protein
MRALSASELLRAWEHGGGQTLARRALILLAAASAEMSLAELAQLSVGQRDARLLTLREWLFGARVEGLVSCPACREPLELAFDVADVRAIDGSEITDGSAPDLLRLDGYDVRFRPPNSEDLEAIAACQNTVDARGQLLARCALEVRREGIEESASQLPAHVADVLIERIAQADRQANVQLSLTCPACRHRWLATFDIASFLWNEINDWAQRTLREVHIIASAYSWHEADILEMSAQRRHFYLEMIGGA